MAQNHTCGVPNRREDTEKYRKFFKDEVNEGQTKSKQIGSIFTICELHPPKNKQASLGY